MHVGAYTQVVACVLRILHRLLSEEQQVQVVNGTLLPCDVLSVCLCAQGMNEKDGRHEQQRGNW